MRRGEEQIPPRGVEKREGFDEVKAKREGAKRGLCEKEVMCSKRV